MSAKAERAILAGGCFWVMQQLLRHRDGVIATRVGWIGGDSENPSEGNSGSHAEAVEVTFDAERLSYRDLLKYFFLIHRADLGEEVVGIGYRSEIFHTNEAQRVVAEQTLRDFNASVDGPDKAVTRVSKAGRFWAEAPEQQDYLHRLCAGSQAPVSRQRETAGAA